MTSTHDARSTAGDRPVSAAVRYDADDHGVVTLVLDRPESRNALSDEMLDALLGALERARADDAVRVVVLASSHERVFSAGGDLKAFASDASTVEKYAGLDRFPGSTRRSAPSGSRSSARRAGTSSPGPSASPWPATW